ncbi:ribonuclease D [Pelovirga terrestris]|uniref:HRDC domain-containing protein n=1 Tax=Pelovirga terrestris TaxID=2771352 RepID=A0A8J6R5B7_9BACT|nr:ribonuclease D [Pelovirga terrestris]MBD1400089.1 HRDC domain-containing protein [Pelovirga terrestris]
MSLPTILTTAVEVADFAVELAGHETIAVDLEADSMHNYQEKVCLLQFTTPQRTVLIDPLAIPDLDSLKSMFANPDQRKIFHAADYDIRSLGRDFEISVRGLFDTMISCQFLGEERFGLADVLKKYYGVELNKRFQRADWSLRPLSDDMIRYAAEDTSHLHDLARLLEDKLVEKGRLAWVKEECELLEQVRFSPQNGPLFLRFKGAGSLKPRQLAALEHMLVWRDDEARRRNTPHYKVLGNKPLLELARLLPEGRNQLEGIDGLPPRMAGRYGGTILQQIGAALELTEEQLPTYPRSVRKEVDPAVEGRFNALKKWRTKIAAELQLDPGVLINNALLEELALRNPRSFEDPAIAELLKRWQQQVLAKGIIATLQRT